MGNRKRTLFDPSAHSTLEVDAYSGKYVAPLPRSLHQQLARRADQGGTSLNQLVVMLLAEGMGRWAERERPSAAGAYPYLQTGTSAAVHDKDG